MTGNELRDLRINASMTQRGLAEKLCCTIASVSNWEGGVHRIQRIYELAVLKIFEDNEKKREIK